MKARFSAITCVMLAVMSLGMASVAGTGEKADPGDSHSAVAPQLGVACTGWHALCSGVTDCQLSSEGVDCDCWRVNEPYIVMTSEIQDVKVKRMTEIRCTNRHPCDVDEAPVCGAINDGRYEVEGVNYLWVSTFSYRGWCGYYDPKACDPAADGYVGDFYWAICDGAPCTETENPPDPDRPLRCQCRLEEGAFIGVKNSCTGENGGIISSVPLWVWDFENDTWQVPVPGYDFVKGACDSLHSDAFPE